MSTHVSIAMESQWGAVAFVLLSGFIVAGLLNALHQNIYAAGQDDDGLFLLYFGTPLSTLWSLIICFFAGPYLIAKNAYHFWRLKHIPFTVLAFCGMISVIWSFCSGVFIVEAGLSLGILHQ